MGGSHPLVAHTLPPDHWQSVRASLTLLSSVSFLGANRNDTISSGFFAIFLSLLVPPGYPVQIYIVVCVIFQDPAASLTCHAGLQLIFQSLLGLLTAWGLGSAAMRASLSVRSHLVDEATLQKVTSRSATSQVASSPLLCLTPTQLSKLCKPRTTL